MDSFVGQKGMVVFSWYPNHANRTSRSHCGETIHLVKIINIICLEITMILRQSCTEIDTKIQTKNLVKNIQLMMMGTAYFVPVKEKGTRVVKDTPEMR